jgi:beta-glucanase (GH16 family)
LKILVKLGAVLSGVLLAGQVCAQSDLSSADSSLPSGSPAADGQSTTEVYSGVTSLADIQAPPPPSPGSAFRNLVWSDEFNGYGQPNPANWNYHVGSGFNKDAGAFQGWGNGEWQWYRPENCYQEKGNLVLRADYHLVPASIAAADRYQFSCRITTQGRQSWTYGRIEARLAAPNVMGSWPAFWMLGDASDASYTDNYIAQMPYFDTLATNWSSIGEIDIFEHVNVENFIYQNVFWDLREGVHPWAEGHNANAVNTAAVGNVSEFHTYAVEWDAASIRWFVDGVQTQVIDIVPANMEEFRKPFHLIFNLALAGRLTQGMEPRPLEFPVYMYVDYVRVYQ